MLHIQIYSDIHPYNFFDTNIFGYSCGVVLCTCHSVFLTSIRNCGRSDALRPMLAIMRQDAKVNVG